MDPEGMHLGNPKTAPIFIKNFMADFRAILGKKHVIKDFKKCDFTPITNHLNEQKLVKKAITDGERKRNKSEKDKVMFKYGYALVDGHLEKVGNYNMVRLRTCDRIHWSSRLKYVGHAVLGDVGAARRLPGARRAP